MASASTPLSAACFEVEGLNLGFRVEGFGIQVPGFEIRVLNLGALSFGFRVSGCARRRLCLLPGEGFQAKGLGIGVQDLGLESGVKDFGFRVSGFGFRVSGL